MENFTIHSTEDMLILGNSLGELAKPGDLLFLFGELGTGKTTLTKGIAQGLGVTDEITSPTFQIRKSYQGRYPLYHLDLYRLNDPLELDILELEDFLDEGITVVEWGDLLRQRLQLNHLEVQLGFHPLNHARSISITPYGQEYTRYLNSKRSLADVNSGN